MNLGRYVRRTAEHHPDAEAVVCGHVRLTYAELDDHSDRLAAALTGLGLSRGERVATLAANRAELVVTEVALYKAGLTRARSTPASATAKSPICCGSRTPASCSPTPPTWTRRGGRCPVRA